MLVKCSLCGCLQESDMKTCANCHAIFRVKEETQELRKEEVKNEEIKRGIVPYISVVGFVLSFFNPILGLIFSSIGISRAKKTNAKKGFGVAGLIISIVEIVIIVIIAILAFALLVELFNVLSAELEELFAELGI